ncbi:pyridoxamine 5'-phosphate oxidase [Anaplasma centrale]|nr:pyridoxamine 5'-phosphate oxidase [Anaplasma centrale]
MDIFGLWYSEMLQAAAEGHVHEPSAMVLATCDAQNRPSARVVLLKKYGEAGFEFVTNFDSRKGREIANNPQVALVFDWRYIGKQVRVEGVATLVDTHESDTYHASRSRESKISAWCSKQSTILESRELLLEQFEREQQRFEGQEIPRPEHWGGIRVIPRVVEFWEDGAYRLHSRKRYSLGDDGTWSSVNLYP